MIDELPEVVAVERVHYCAGSEFVTGSDIAQVLLHYARWVAVRGDVDVIDVPTVTSDGGIGRISLLLTATTQMSAATVEPAGRELTDPEFVGRLRAEVTRLSRPVHAVAAEAAPVMVHGDFGL
jgi:hypothetical protein